MPSAINYLPPDLLLAELGVGFGQMGFVNEAICPVTPVAQQSSLYPKWGKEHLRLRKDNADARSDINTADYEMSREKYTLDGHSLAHFIGDDEPVAPAFDRRKDATKLLTESLSLMREYNAISYLLDSNNYADGGSVNTTAANLGDKDTDVGEWLDSRKDVVMNACGRLPNCWAIGRDVWLGIKSNSGLRYNILGTNQGVLTVELVRQYLELDELIVSAGMYDSAPEGQDATSARLWTAEHGLLFWKGDTVVDQYGRTGIGEKSPTFARQFVWQPSPQAGALNPEAAGIVGGMKVLRWRNQGAPKGTGGGEWLQTSMYYGFKITCAAAAELQTNLLGSS